MPDTYSRDDYINQFRQSFPTRSNWSDDDILDAYADQYADSLADHPILAEHAQAQRMADTNIFKEAAGAVGAGVDQFQGKLYDTAALAGDAFGSERLKDWGNQGRDRNDQEAGKYDPVVKQWEGVRTPSDFAYWLTNITGTNAPQMAGTLVAGAGAAALAPEAAVGAAALAGSSIMGFTQMQNYGELQKLGGDNVVPIAIANGLIGSVLEAVGPASIIGKALGKTIEKKAAAGIVESVLKQYMPGQLVNVALTAAKHGSTEMLTEIAQEATSVAAEMVSNRNNPDFKIDDNQVKSRLINSGVAGFFLGGGTGALEHLTHTDDHTPASDPRAANDQSGAYTRPSIVPQVAPLTEAELANASNNSITPAAAPVSIQTETGSQTELATPTQQEYLVTLGMSPLQAATIPAHEAADLILQSESAKARDQAAQEAATEAQTKAQAQAALDARMEQAAAVQDKERQQSAAEDEIRNEQLASAADDNQAEQVAAAKTSRAEQLRAQLSQARSPDTAQAGRAMERGVKKVGQALTPDKAPVATNLLVESNKEAAPRDTMNPAALPSTLAPSQQTPATAPAANEIVSGQQAAPVQTAPVSPTSFVTAKGSTYQVNENGNTVRTKRSLGRGQNEVHAASPSVYLRPEAAQHVQDESMASNRVILRENGSQIRPEQGEDLRGRNLEIAVVDKNGREIYTAPVENHPAVGLHPFEISYDGDQKSYHLGNQITEVSLNSAKPVSVAGPSFAKLEETPLRRFIDRESTVSAESATRLEQGHDRWQVFKTDDGQVELRKVSSSGTLAVRENMDATPKSIRSALDAAGIRVSQSTVENAMKGQNVRQKEAILAEAARQGYSRTEGSERVTARSLEEQGKHYAGTIVVPSGSNMSHYMKMSQAEFDSAFGKSQQLGQDKGVTKIGREKPKVIANIVSDMGQKLAALSSSELEKYVVLPGKDQVRALYESSLRTVGSPEAVQAYEKLTAGKQTERARAALTDALNSIPRESLNATAPSIAAQASVTPTTVQTPAALPAESAMVSPSSVTPPAIRFVPSGEQMIGLISKVFGGAERAKIALSKASPAQIFSVMETLITKGKTAGLTAEQQAAVNDMRRMTPAERAGLHQLFTEQAKIAIRMMEDKVETETIDDRPKGVVFREASTDYLAPQEKINEFYTYLLREASARGIPIMMSQAKAAIKEGGAYNPSNRAVSLALRNITEPGPQDLMALVHEVAHDSLEGQPEWVKRLVHDAFDRIPSKGLAFFDNPDADHRVATGENVDNLPNEEYVQERAVEHAALFGLDRSYTRNMFATVWRTVKDYILRGAMYLQEQILGKDQTGGSLAKAFMENLTAQFLAGDTTRIAGFLQQFGKVPTFAEIQQYLPVEGVNVHRVSINPATGTPLFGFSGDTSLLAAAHNIEGPILAAKELIGQGEIISQRQATREIMGKLESAGSVLRLSPEVNPSLPEIFKAGLRDATANAQTTIALANHWDTVFSQLVDKLIQRFPNRNAKEIVAARQAGDAVANNFTRERLFSLLRHTDPKAVVQSAEDTLRSMLERETGKKVDDLGVDKTLTLDGLSGPMRGRAELELISGSSRLAAKASRALAAIRDTLSTKQSEVETRRARILEIANKIADFKTTERETTKAIVSGLEDITRQATRAQAGEVKAANAVLAALEDQATDAAVIDDAGRLRSDLKLSQRLVENMNVPELPLLSIFRELFDIEKAHNLDLSDARPAEIRAAILEHVQANSQSSLRNLVRIGEGPDASVRGTALLSSVIAFAQHQAVTTDALRLQFSKASDRAQQMIAVRDALKETNENTLKSIKDAAAKRFDRPGNRLIQSLLNERDSLLKEQRHLANLEQDAEALRLTNPVFEEAQRRAAANNEVSAHWAPTPDALVFNPADANQDGRLVVEQAEPLRMSRDAYIKSDEMRGVLRNQKAWLDARDADKDYIRDSTYFQMKRQHDTLLRFAVDHEVGIMDGVRRGAMVGGLGEIAIRTGTPAGQAFARSLQAVETWKRSKKAENQTLGKKWENAQTDFYHHTKGLDTQWVHEALYDYGMDYMNFVQSQTEEGGLDSLRKIFLQRGDLSSQIMASDGAWKAFSHWLHVTNEVNQAKVRESVDAGNRVRDEKVKLLNPKTGEYEVATRTPVQQAAFTTGGRQPTNTIRAVLWGMVNRNLMMGDGENNPFAELGLRLKTNPEGVRAAWMNLMADADFSSKVVDPLVLNFKPTLPAPENNSGVKVPLNPSAAHAAWAESGGNILKFAELVHQELGLTVTPEGLQNYQQALLNYLDGRMKLITKRMIEANSVDSNRIGGVPHIAMDAREGNDLPSEWMTYPTFSVDDLNHMTHVSAANGFLGRDLEVAKGLSDRISQDLNGIANLMPPTDAMKEALRKANPKKMEEIESAAKLARDYGDGYFAKNLANMLDPALGATGDFGPLMEFFQVGVIGMLSGVRTSLRDLASLVRPFQIEKSLSSDTVKAVGSNTMNALRYSFAAVTNSLLGTDLMAKDPFTKAIERAGFSDPAQVMLWKELMTGTHGKNNAFDKSTGGRITGAIRRLRNAASLGRLGFNNGAAGPSLRVNPFPFFTQVQLFSGLKTYMKRTSQLAQLAGDFYRTNPDKLGKTLTAKDLGLNNPIAYETIKDKLALNGVSIEKLGEKLARTDNVKFEDILDDQTVRGIASFIMDEQMVESSPNTRPVWTQTSKLGRLSGALVGWSFGNTAQLTNLYRDPSRRANVKTILNATAVTMLGMLPAAVAVSLMVDLYDEDLVKKKSNQIPLTGEDWMQSVFERAVNLGTLGLPGEVVAGFTTSRDGAGTRALSIDQRIVWVNSLQQLVTSLQTLNSVGPNNVNYANFWRPLGSSLGAGGLLQNIQLFNGLFGAPNVPLLRDEADVTNRTNVNNWLRVAGREVGLEVKKFNSGGASTVNAVTPWLTNMQLAALSNDVDSFRIAYRGAIKAADGLPASAGDSAKYVREAFASRNPLKSVFNVTPTTTEVQLVLRSLPPEGRDAVSQAISLYNRYSSAIGAKPYTGSPGTSALALQRAKGRALGLSSDEASTARIRAELASRRSSVDF